MKLDSLRIKEALRAGNAYAAYGILCHFFAINEKSSISIEHVPCIGYENEEISLVTSSMVYCWDNVRGFRLYAVAPPEPNIEECVFVWLAESSYQL